MADQVSLTIIIFSYSYSYSYVHISKYIVDVFSTCSSIMRLVDVWQVCFSPDGRYVATGGQTGRIHLHSLRALGLDSSASAIDGTQYIVHSLYTVYSIILYTSISMYTGLLYSTVCILYDFSSDEHTSRAFCFLTHNDCTRICRRAGAERIERECGVRHARQVHYGHRVCTPPVASRNLSDVLPSSLQLS